MSKVVNLKVFVVFVEEKVQTCNGVTVVKERVKKAKPFSYNYRYEHMDTHLLSVHTFIIAGETGGMGIPPLACSRRCR